MVNEQLGFDFGQTSKSIENIRLPDAEIQFLSNFYEAREREAIFLRLSDEINWQQDAMRNYGKLVPLPRLTAWYGDKGTNYAYSGIGMSPSPWIPLLLNIRARIETVSNARYNSVLLNRYRDGQDSVSWHQDNEKELGEEPTIASLSFGATRKFQMKHKFRRNLERLEILLTDGSLLIMRGATQNSWLHQVPKTNVPVGERINLTFRMVY